MPYLVIFFVGFARVFNLFSNVLQYKNVPRDNSNLNILSVQNITCFVAVSYKSVLLIFPVACFRRLFGFIVLSFFADNF